MHQHLHIFEVLSRKKMTDIKKSVFVIDLRNVNVVVFFGEG